jgi:hypothetical protein
MLNKGNIMNITDLDEWNSVDVLVNRIHELSLKKYNVTKPLDKYKYRELQVGDILGHKVFEGASGGGENDETFGADAHEQDGTKAEYKSVTMNSKKLDMILGKGMTNKNGTTLKVSGVYNGASSKETIDRYREINHYFSLHDGGFVVAIMKVDTDFVCNTLQTYQDKRTIKTTKMIKEGVDKLPTTNCNSVKVECVDTNSVMKFVYKNKKYFG